MNYRLPRRLFLLPRLRPGFFFAAPFFLRPQGAFDFAIFSVLLLVERFAQANRSISLGK